MVYTEIVFVWDPAKACANFAKHGISFERAITAFDDPSSWMEPDSEHSSESEKREWLIGEADAVVLVVVFTIRLPGNVVRIISARRASRRERRQHEQRTRL